MEIVNPQELIARNPATGEEIRRIVVTPIGEIAERVRKSREAAKLWAKRPTRERIQAVYRWWKILCREAEPLAEAIRVEIGKPRCEAFIEVNTSLDAIRWVVNNGEAALKNQKISPGWQRLALMRSARLSWAPLGVVAILGTWNYPFLLDAPAIAGALVAGNGVIWKPSEQCPHVSDLLRETLLKAELPEDLVASLFGGREVGATLIEQEIDKAFFTGGSATGHAIASKLGGRGISLVAELSGFDPAIVMADAPLDSTARGLCWGAFVGAGQTCVAVKRIYVNGPTGPFLEKLSETARSLRIGDPSGEVDVGPMISERARSDFHERIEAAVAAGAERLVGGEPISGPGYFYQPTILVSKRPEPERILEGVFGPVVIVRGDLSRQEVVEAANATRFGLAASVWGRDYKVARGVAGQLQAGMVSINDAVTPTGLAAAPFGGCKGSGYGRVRGALGLREFTSAQVLHERSVGGYRPQLFPYSSGFEGMLAFYRRLFHRSS